MCSLVHSSADTSQPSCHVTRWSYVDMSTPPQVSFLPQPTTTLLSSSNHNSQPKLRPDSQSFFNVNNSSFPFSLDTRHRIAHAIQGGWANSTLRRYTGTIKQFLRFCDEEHIPEHLRFPVDEFVLCAFAASSFKRHAGGTPRSLITALKAWHVTHNVEWKGSA